MKIRIKDGLGLWIAFLCLGQAYGDVLLSGPYVLDAGPTHARICWQTRKNMDGLVRFRAKEGGEWRRVKGSFTQFHSIPITGLRPASEYIVRIRKGEDDLAQFSLRTPPLKSEVFTFYVYGDTRTFPNRHKMVADAIAEEAKALKQLTFVAHIGDFARYGSDKNATTEQFFTPAGSMLRLLSLVPVKGNHEEGAKFYEKYFPVPSRDGVSTKEGDYYQDYGSVRILVINQSKRLWSRGKRMVWIKKVLADAGDKWRIVLFHAPIYSSGSHGSDLSFRRVIESVLVAGKVHVVFSAHDHNYERIKPREGVTYFVTGGGGAPLRALHGGAEAFSVKFSAVHHFLTVTVGKENLIIKALASDGENKRFKVFDEVEIQKTGDWP
ncbi:MAG: metallophosphoesterase family protein [Kiritimatiellae bacterium]|nr:metallophosphoesterase family protein [Kiritimatiellia bacterium]